MSVSSMNGADLLSKKRRLEQKEHVYEELLRHNPPNGQ